MSNHDNKRGDGTHNKKQLGIGNVVAPPCVRHAQSGDSNNSYCCKRVSIRRRETDSKERHYGRPTILVSYRLQYTLHRRAWKLQVRR